MVTVTSPPSISISRTRSRSVTGRRSSGSMTCSSAFQISSREGSTKVRVPSPTGPSAVLRSHARGSEPVPEPGSEPAPERVPDLAQSQRQRVALSSAVPPGCFHTSVTWPGLVWRNLMRRAVRTGLTAAGVAIGVALIVALLSIAAGVRRTAADLIHVGRADFGVFQQGASDLTRSLLPESLEKGLRSTPGITDVAPIFLRVSHVQTRDAFLLFGLRRND